MAKDGHKVVVASHQVTHRDEQGNVLAIIETNNDVTDLKQAEQEREITVEFLRLVNASTGSREMIRTAATFFQEQSGCEAVGIRLREGDDYPYCEARGFPTRVCSGGE